MKKVFIYLILCFTFSLFVIPVEAKGSLKDSISSTVSNSIYILDDENSDAITNIENANIDMSKYDQDQNCDSLLGDRNDEKSVMWLIDKALKVIQIVGPIMVVVLSSIDFAKVIVSGDDEAMAKAGKKLGIRLILAAALFFIPLLVNLLLDTFGLTGSCNLQ